MTENQFLDRFRLGVVRSVRLVGMPSDTGAIRVRLEVFLANGEIEDVHTAKNQTKGYRVETAIAFLASSGVATADIDLASINLNSLKS